MTLFAKLIFSAAFVLFISTAAFAQSTDDSHRLNRGDNEFGFWAGFSPRATTIFGGLHDDEAEDRKFFIAAFRYVRLRRTTRSRCNTRSTRFRLRSRREQL
jgi:hypothetical protein